MWTGAVGNHDKRRSSSLPRVFTLRNILMPRCNSFTSSAMHGTTPSRLKWWIPDSTILVGTSIQWRKALATGHNHCLLCWKALDDTEAYTPGTARNDWACPSCYAEYIEHGPPWARRGSVADR